MPNIKRNCRGVSLIEIVIVAVLLGIVLAIGIPYFGKSKANNSLRTQADQLKSSLEYTASIAKKEGENAQLKFASPDTASPSYEVFDSSGNRVKLFTFKDSVTVNCTAISGSTIEFKPNGTTTSGGNITVKSGNTDKTFTVSINQNTGMIKITEN